MKTFYIALSRNASPVVRRGGGSPGPLLGPGAVGGLAPDSPRRHDPGDRPGRVDRRSSRIHDATVRPLRAGSSRRKVLLDAVPRPGMLLHRNLISSSHLLSILRYDTFYLCAQGYPSTYASFHLFLIIVIPPRSPVLHIVLFWCYGQINLHFYIGVSSVPKCRTSLLITR